LSQVSIKNLNLTFLPLLLLSKDPQTKEYQPLLYLAGKFYLSLWPRAKGIKNTLSFWHLGNANTRGPRAFSALHKEKRGCWTRTELQRGNKH